METPDLKHRGSSGDPVAVRDAEEDKKTSVAKLGARSLSVALLLPLLLVVSDIFLFGRRSGDKKISPALWLLHTAWVGYTVMMGLAAWMVWAKGGFHKNPVGLGLYLGQLVLSLAWDPIVVWGGCGRVGLVACMGMVGTLCGCFKVFREVNPMAGELVKPCLAWAAFLSFVTFKLAYL